MSDNKMSSSGEIRAQRLRYRDRPQTDDHIEIIFDTYRDEIRGTIFVVNPLGSKDEGLVNGYQRYEWNWNSSATSAPTR